MTQQDPIDVTATLRAYGQELDRRDAENLNRCPTCHGRHGVVEVCGGCEEPVGDCICEDDND